MAVKSRMKHQKRKRIHTETSDCDSENKNPNRRQVKKSIFDNSSDGVEEDAESNSIIRYTEQRRSFIIRNKSVDCVPDEKEKVCDHHVKKEVPTVNDWIKSEEFTISDEYMEKEKHGHAILSSEFLPLYNDQNSLSRCNEVPTSSNVEMSISMEWNTEDLYKGETDLVSSENCGVSFDNNWIKKELDDNRYQRIREYDNTCQRIRKEPDGILSRYIRARNESDLTSNLTSSTDDVDGKVSLNRDLFKGNHDILDSTDNFDGKVSLNCSLFKDNHDSLDSQDYQNLPVSQHCPDSVTFEETKENVCGKVMSPIIGRKQKQLCKTTNSFMSSSSSQVTKNQVDMKLRKNSGGGNPQEGGIRHTQEHHKRLPSSPIDSNMSDQPFPVNIPLEFLYNTSSSPEANRVPSLSPKAKRVLSLSPGAKRVPSLSPEANRVPSLSPKAKRVPSLSPGAKRVPSLSPEATRVPKCRKAKSKSRRFTYLFGEVYASDESIVASIKESEVDARSVQSSNSEEEYIPKAGSKRCDSKSTSYVDYNPSPVAQTSNLVSDDCGDSIACRRSKRLQSKDRSPPFEDQTSIDLTPGKEETSRSSTPVQSPNKLNKVCPSKKTLEAKKVISKAKKELIKIRKQMLEDSQPVDPKKINELNFKWEEEKETSEAKRVSETEKDVDMSRKQSLNDSQFSDSNNSHQEFDFKLKKKMGSRIGASDKTKRQLKKKIMERQTSYESQLSSSGEKGVKISKKQLLNDFQDSDSNNSHQNFYFKLKKKMGSSIGTSDKTKETQKTKRQIKKKVINKQTSDESQPSSSVEKVVKVSKKQLLNDFQLSDFNNSIQEFDFELEKKRDNRDKTEETQITKRQVKKKVTKKQKLDESQPSSSGVHTSQDDVVKRKRVVGRIRESKRTKEAKKMIRQVEKELADMNKQNLEDETLLHNSDTFNEEFVINGEKKKVTKGLVKRKYNKKSKNTILPSNQPTIKDCLFMKSLSVSTEGKKCQKQPRKKKEETTNNLSATDLFTDSSVTNNSIRISTPVSCSDVHSESDIACHSLRNYFSQRMNDSEDLFYNSSQCDQDENQLLSNNNSQRLSDSENVFSSQIENHREDDFDESQNSDRGEYSLLGTTASEPLSPLEDMERLPPLQDENQDHLNSLSESSVIVTEEVKVSNLSLEKLNICHQKLKNLSQEELKDRIDGAYDYLDLIMKGKASNERHLIFKENPRVCRSMFSELVYGPYLEDQVDFVFKVLSTYYLKPLQVAMKDIHRGRSYIWKVLAPSFLIKLVMDIENVAEKEAEGILEDICLRGDSMEKINIHR